MKPITLLIVILFSFNFTVKSQFGLGLTAAFDAYQRYSNPIDPDDGTISNSAGFIGGFGVGPKIWVGGENISISLEGQINYGAWGYSFGDDKGHGLLAFPFMFKANRNAASGFHQDKGIGMSLGAGIQYSRTEVFRDWEVYPDLERKLFPTYVGELGLHVTEGDGMDLALYIRFGMHEKEARSFNLGLVYNMNFFHK